MATQPPVQAIVFQLGLQKFKASLSDREKREFSVTTLQDLKIAIETIQQKQRSERKLRAMSKLGRFLEGMQEYDKIVAVFLNTSEILAFVWGPMKFLLQVACTFYEAFDTLLDAYQRIGEHIHLLKQYEAYFQNQPHMCHPLALVYEDILAFHGKAMQFFKKKMWRQLFHAIWKTFEFEFGAILRNMREHMTLIQSQATIAQFTEVLRVQELAKVSMENQENAELHRRREVVRQWLSAANYEADQETFFNICQQYPGTGHWLFLDNKFNSWFDSMFCSNHLLWLNGIPGAGKTVLASLVINELQKPAQKQQGISVIFFYCRYLDSERSTFLGLARGLLAQLLSQDDALLSYLHDRASKSGQTILSTPSIAKDLLETSICNSDKLYVVIDGLDECERDERRQIVAFFEDIHASLPQDEADSLRCLFLSQDDNIARKDFAKVSSLKITEAHTRKDIQAYALPRSKEIQAKFGLTPDRQYDIYQMIVNKAEGMFLFARLMTAFLYDQTSVADLDEQLSPATFPQGPLKLEEAYSRIMQRLNTGTATHVQTLKLLRWMVCAKRPMYWREIQCAVSVNMDDQVVDWDRRKFSIDSKELGGSLVETSADGTIILVHHTARRYLIDQKVFDIEAGELELANLCIGYLSLPCFERNIDGKDLAVFILLGYYAFSEYAYAYWSSHLDALVRQKESKLDLEEIRETVEAFIDMHWIEPRTKTAVRKPFIDRWTPLENNDNLEKLVLAGHLAQRQLIASTSPNVDEQVLSLQQTTTKVRKFLEEASTTTSDMDRFHSMYGDKIFRCQRASCVRFYDGFATEQLRDEHVPKHERSFFCSFQGCAIGKLGCATFKELQHHEIEYHDMFNLDEDELDFPEAPVEKLSFQCIQCDAKFTRKHNLSIHMRKHNAPNQKAFVCSHCGKSFARSGDRTRHESTTHSTAKISACNGTLKDGSSWGCGREFNRGDMLSRHWRSEKGKTCIGPKEQEEAFEAAALSSYPVTPSIT
ncbi:hypothetical protein HBI82_035170 [Parastagonospora nodorum]|nr:hypothetical protein HBH46_068970 [Parastagonospora nodorum]KAH5781499.1 hypothetical protein HBI97_102760 [Parastagonospora nodorum]KAH5823242.1 hypothetical protein HBI96_034370 [Parastagonospora nodorum]KAH5836074.1 hypothetical protein HBI94_003590 [Parastagonospora nodorum]KAH5841409.1 hypothetical protein HBI93_028140 [Parastagonospora nodorum]